MPAKIHNLAGMGGAFPARKFAAGIEIFGTSFG